MNGLDVVHDGDLIIISREFEGEVIAMTFTLEELAWINKQIESALSSAPEDKTNLEIRDEATERTLLRRAFLRSLLPSPSIP